MTVKLTMTLRELRINRQRLRIAADRGKRRAVSKQLAFIRQRARTKILRRRKRASAPGQPPSVHASSGNYATLKNIRFTYDSTSGSGIVGPVRLNQVNMTAGGSVPVPHIHEHGATVTIQEVAVRIPWRYFKPHKYRGRQYKIERPNVYLWKRRDLRRRAREGERRRTRRARYPARPFMSVALEQEIAAGTIMDPWRNAITAR